MSVPDRLLLGYHQQVETLPIFVDFLPALELRKPKSDGIGYQHDSFFISKHYSTCE